MFKQTLIIGLGLLGSSLAQALRKHELSNAVVGCSRSAETVRKALKLGIIEGGSTEPTDFVKESDLIVFCLPMGIYAETAEKISDHLKSNAIITDVGSAKQFVIDEVLPKLSAKQRSLFVPGHPIAGSEKSGPEAGDAGLFAGRKVILTPVEQTNKAICNKVEKMWSDIGAKVSYMSPDEHDEIYANVSHSVQFLAYVYRLAFPGQSKNPDANFQRFFRIAKSNSSIWLDIFNANKDCLLKSLLEFRKSFIEQMDQVNANVRLPKVIANAAIKMAGDDKSYAGNGFKDFTSAAYDEVDCDQTILDVPNFLSMLDTLSKALEKGDLKHYLPSS